MASQFQQALQGMGFIMNLMALKDEQALAKKKQALSEKEQRSREVTEAREHRIEYGYTTPMPKKHPFSGALSIPKERPRFVPGLKGIERSQKLLALRKGIAQEEVETRQRLQDEKIRKNWLAQVGSQNFDDTNLIKLQKFSFTVRKKGYMDEAFRLFKMARDERENLNKKKPTRIEMYPWLNRNETMLKRGALNTAMADYAKAIDPEKPQPALAVELANVIREINAFDIDELYGFDDPDVKRAVLGREVSEEREKITLPTLEKATLGAGQFTLGPEQKRFGAGGKLIAEGAPKKETEKLTKGEKKLQGLAKTFYQTIGRANSARMGVGQFIPDPNREKVAAQEYKRAKELVKQYVKRGGKLSDLGIPDITEQMYLFYQDKFDLSRAEVLKRYINKLNLAETAKQ